MWMVATTACPAQLARPVPPLPPPQQTAYLESLPMEEQLRVPPVLQAGLVLIPQGWATPCVSLDSSQLLARQPVLTVQLALPALTLIRIIRFVLFPFDNEVKFGSF